MKHFSKMELPPMQHFSFFHKRKHTPAVRIDGPFEVETREGTLACPDGWLAIDSEGFPYPIADTEFRNIYEPVEPW